MGQPPPDPDEVNAAMRRFALRRFNDVHARLKAKRATYEAEVTPLVAERAACIRELQAAGWTLQQIADEVGVSKARLWRMLHGKG